MSLGTELAIAAFADQCIKYGVKLVKRCHAYRHAGEEVRALLVTIELNWQKTEAMIRFVQKLIPSLPETYLFTQSYVLSELTGKLKTATHRLEQLLKSQRVDDDHSPQAMADRLKRISIMGAGRKAKYAFSQEALQSIMDDLEKWQARFNPCWMLIIRMESRLDQELSWLIQEPMSQPHTVIKTAKELREAARMTEDDASRQTVWLNAAGFELPSTAASLPPLSTVRLRGFGQQVLVDTMHCLPIADIARFTKDVCKLGHILSKVDPSVFGILQCRGIIKDVETVKVSEEDVKHIPSFSFVFTIPAGLESSRSLRSLLVEGAAYPLNERLNVARKLTHSVLFLHSISFVHKNIRPETIVVYRDSTSNIGSPFLVGFQKFRPEGGQTYLAGDEAWEENLYRHPSRQGILPEESYKMQHDIYSLGVVLLEIGLWTSFIRYEAGSGVAQLREGFGLALPGDRSQVNEQRQNNKHALEILAAHELPKLIGREQAGFGVMEEDSVTVTDEDGMVIGSRFIEYILDKIQEISL